MIAKLLITHYEQIVDAKKKQNKAKHKKHLCQLIVHIDPSPLSLFLECISLSNLELIVQRKFDKFKEEILKENRSALSGLINDNEKLRTEVVNLNNKNKELEKNQLELKSEINTIKTEIEKKDMEVDENQNESQNQNEIALLGVTIATYNIELTKIKNDIDMYNKTNDQALENIRTDLTMLKSSQKDEIESCLNNATLSIKTNSNATDRDNFSTTIFEVFPGLERDLSAENIPVTEYIAINQTPHTSTPKECIAETNSEISCDYSEETEVCFAIQPIAHVSPSDAIPSCSGVKRKEKTVKKRRFEWKPYAKGNQFIQDMCKKLDYKRANHVKEKIFAEGVIHKYWEETDKMENHVYNRVDIVCKSKEGKH
ncbi:unnamed protein product [Mytilus edulis]|uniref:Uncharacterized protein n=1 Tax=Mytilus edulis TaxID=6550 RepID=A0A8S3SG55_MYTED|nr:unnamed protein product [Mytilus edulis]